MFGAVHHWWAAKMKMQKICIAHAKTVKIIFKRENRNDKCGKVWGPKIALILPLMFEWHVFMSF